MKHLNSFEGRLGGELARLLLYMACLVLPGCSGPRFLVTQPLEGPHPRAASYELGDFVYCARVIPNEGRIGLWQINVTFRSSLVMHLPGITDGAGVEHFGLTSGAEAEYVIVSHMLDLKIDGSKRMDSSMEPTAGQTGASLRWRGVRETESHKTSTPFSFTKQRSPAGFGVTALGQIVPRPSGSSGGGSWPDPHRFPHSPGVGGGGSSCRWLVAIEVFERETGRLVFGGNFTSEHCGSSAALGQIVKDFATEFRRQMDLLDGDSDKPAGS